VKPYLWMLIGAVAFASMSILAHALSDGVSWVMVALARSSCALLFTLIVARVQRTELVFFRPPTLWMRSICGSISLLCSFYAFKHLPASDVIAITNTFPIWVAILSWPLLGERPTREVWFAVLCAVTGSILINQPQLGFGSNVDPSFAGEAVQNASAAAASPQTTLPQAAVPFAAFPWLSHRLLGGLLAAISSVFSAVVVIGLNLLHKTPSQAIVVHFSLVATVFCLAAAPFEPAFAASVASLKLPMIGLLAALGLCATIGQIFLTKAFAAGPASKVAVVALSQVVFCYLFELGFLGRRFQWLSAWGMILIIGPTALMIWRKKSRAARAAATIPAEGLE
jgi:drug/metabolite transporter (DMT)-like permease